MIEKHPSAFNAEEYDEKIKQTLPYYEEFYTQITDVITVSGKQKPCWLDVGCGTGMMYGTAKERIELGEFVFCDNDSEMLQIAKDRFLDSKNIFIEKSVLDLEFSSKYDVITAVQLNHYFNEKERMRSVRNCYRALKDEGYFFTYENFAPFSEVGKELMLNRWENYQISKGRSSEQVKKHSSRYGTAYHPITVKKHIELLKDCGFGTVEIIWLSYLQVGLFGRKGPVC